MIRAVNSTLDPERVADALVAHAADWLPATGWLVLAIDDAGRMRAMGARGLPAALEPGATAVGQCVIKSRELFCAADISVDRRFAGAAPAAVVAFPLECRGRTVGALVG
ncbi:MAG: hypothetical protein HOQ29_11130, partial [Acidobacteria bacterium]|nr:hypothetical protein [Acidobacteriota bacterium]